MWCDDLGESNQQICIVKPGCDISLLYLIRLIALFVCAIALYTDT